MMAICTTTFAESNAERKAFEINLNETNIASSLQLTGDQYDKVYAGNVTFQYETRAAGFKKDEVAQQMSFNKALRRNLKYMKTVLDEDQYRKYRMLLNLTVNNRGLNK